MTLDLALESRPVNAPPAFHLLSKPTGAVCNLDCKYCFFLSKEMLYPGSRFRMADELLEIYIKQLIESHQTPEVMIAWQGGEPTLMGLDFFRRSIEFVAKYRKPQQSVTHTMQTNGVLLDDEWCSFFKEHDFLIGLSIDGPEDIHDTYRVNKGGAGSFKQVMRGLSYLQKHEVEVNTLTTVHNANAGKPLEVYQFLRDEVGSRYMQFIPIVERVSKSMLPLANDGWSENGRGDRPLYIQSGHQVTERSVKSYQYGRFLSDIFDEWVQQDVGNVFVQIFDVTLANLFGQPSLCIFSETCGNALALEHTGDLYSCDHYVEPAYLLGNIKVTHMIELVASEKQRQFGRDKLETLPAYCRKCEVRQVCHGGCPKNRFINTPGGEPGLNYLCAGYKHFFNHVMEPMQIMANLLRQQRAPAEIMNWAKAKTAEEHKNQNYVAGRNEPCPCGSGKKYKNCHGRQR